MEKLIWNPNLNPRKIIDLEIKTSVFKKALVKSHADLKVNPGKAYFIYL